MKRYTKDKIKFTLSLTNINQARVCFVHITHNCCWRTLYSTKYSERVRERESRLLMMNDSSYPHSAECCPINDICILSFDTICHENGHIVWCILERHQNAPEYKITERISTVRGIHPAWSTLLIFKHDTEQDLCINVLWNCRIVMICCIN